MKQTKDKCTIDVHPDKSLSYLRLFLLLGLYLLIFVSPFLRGLYFEKQLVPAIILVTIVFFVLIIYKVLYEDNTFLQKPIDLIMPALLLSYGLSLLTAVHRHDAIVELLKVSSFVMMYYLGVQAGKSDRDFRRLLLAAYLAAVGMAISSLIAAVGWLQLAGVYADGYFRSPLQYSNALAIYLAAMNIVGLAIGLQAKQRFTQLAYAAGNYFLVIVIIGSMSRGTWFLYPLAMGALMYLIPAHYRRRAVYQLLAFTSTGILAGRFFLNNIQGAQETVAVTLLLIGLLLVIGVNRFYQPAISPAQMTEQGTKARLRLIIGMISSLIIVCYISHASIGEKMHYLFPDSAITKIQKTSLQDSSFQQRLLTYGDALKIIKHYPLTGAGGGGWKALYHHYAASLYWVNELHSFYLQTWVSAGLFGLLCLIALAFFFIRMLIKARQVLMRNPDSIDLWGASIAVLLIALHSSIDFELSMAAIGFLFYAMIGAIRGRIAEYQVLDLTAQNVNRITEQNRQKVNKTLLITTMLACIVVLVTALTAACFYTASLKAERGTQALKEQKIDEAQKLYQEAITLDPYQASYRVNLARMEAVRAINTKEPAVYDYTIYSACRASELEPYNLSLHAALFSIYGMLGRTDLQLKETEAAIQSNPFLPEPYEMFATAAISSVWPCYERGQIQEAIPYLKRLIEVRGNISANLFDSTPRLNLAAGQAALLLGEIGLAKTYLTIAVQAEGSIEKTAQSWLAGVTYIQDTKQTSGAAEKGHELKKLMDYINCYNRN